MLITLLNLKGQERNLWYSDRKIKLLVKMKHKITGSRILLSKFDVSQPLSYIESVPENFVTLIFLFT